MRRVATAEIHDVSSFTASASPVVSIASGGEARPPLARVSLRAHTPHSASLVKCCTRMCTVALECVLFVCSNCQGCHNNPENNDKRKRAIDATLERCVTPRQITFSVSKARFDPPAAGLQEPTSVPSQNQSRSWALGRIRKAQSRLPLQEIGLLEEVLRVLPGVPHAPGLLGRGA